MPHHTSAATLQGFMLHSWNSWFVNSHWYPGIPTHACCIPVLWEVRFSFEKTRFPSNHLSGIIFWWWTAGVQEKQALLCQQPSMQMNWPCHIFIHFSHIYGPASNHEVNPSLEGNYSIPEFGMSLISSVFSYYFLSVHFHFRVPFPGSWRSPLQGFPPSDACIMLEKAPALFLQIYPTNKSSVEISPWRTFGATFLLKHLRHFFGSFFSFHWCATRLPSSKNVCHCPSKVRKRLRNCCSTLQQPVVSFCQSLKRCPVFLMLKLSELDFSKNSQREPFCLATVGALPENHSRPPT